MMTTNGEHEPESIGWTGFEAWRESVAAAHRERRQRGERYTGRHRTVPTEPADEQDITHRSA